MFKLVIQDDEGKTTVVPLIRDEITIGRKEGNTIRLTERNVSRRHARIVRSNGAVAIEDLGSYNGVRVNGTRIAQRTSLSVSDRVQIGDYLIELKAEGVEHAGDDGKTQPIERMDPNFIEAQMGTAATIPPAPGGAPGAPPGAPPVVALADTDPAARAIPAMPLAPIGQTSGHARLVVLSSNFAGQEWELARPQMIIGRTDDNDIVVNHRSISRNHAKFVREPDTGRYTISDLQSSNGVRVNGEEYGKVELRRGDVIDLGHVRLRFVEPGEDFVFGRDAQIADVPTGGKNKTLMIAAAVVLLGVGGVAIFALTRGDKNENKKPPGPGSELAVLPDAAGPPMPTPDAAAAIEPQDDFGKKLAACRDLRTSEEWTKVLVCANEMLKDNPNSQDVKDLAEQAKREQKNMLSADTLETAIRGNDYVGAKKALESISPDSVYWEKSKAAHDKLREDYTRKIVDQAVARAEKHDCKWIETRKKQPIVWDEARRALDDVKCEKAGTSIAQPEPECRRDSDCKGNNEECGKGGKCVAKPSGGNNGGSSGECTQEQADAFLQEARDSGSANQWSKMLSKAEASNKCSPSKIARQLALLAACQLGNRDKAMKYWKEFENNTGMQQRCIGIIK
jgi:pSer/pThr/pTyr-binding forkhead associated (FHA) protein